MSAWVGEGCGKPPETSKGNWENVAAVIIQHCCRPNGLRLKPRRSRAMEVWAGGGAPGWRPDQMINPYIDLPFSFCSSEAHAECVHFGKVLSSAECGRLGDFLDSGGSKVSSHPPVQVAPPKCEGPVSCGACVIAANSEIFGMDSGDPDWGGLFWKRFTSQSDPGSRVSVVFLCIQRQNF